jgi:hypothetical protein
VALSHVHCYDYTWLLQKCYRIIDMPLHNQLILGRVRYLTCHVAFLPNVFHFLSPYDEAAGPLKSSILLFVVVNQRCVLYHGSWLFIATCWRVTNWSSIEICQLQYILRPPNIQADLNMLNQMKVNMVSNPYKTYVYSSPVSFVHH